MTKSLKLRAITVAALGATALFAAQPASATEVVTINGFWSGGESESVSFNGQSPIDPLKTQATFYAGGFNTFAGATNFQSFCVDIFHSFSMPATSNSSWNPAAAIIGTQAAADLGRLFTAHGADVAAKGSSNGVNEAAFQLAVWEIVNETSGVYNLATGAFKAWGTGLEALAAADLAQTWLGSLPSISQFDANILKVESVVSVKNPGDYPQDVVVFTPVPEPQTYAMMLVGLGLLGFSARRKNQNLG